MRPMSETRQLGAGAGPRRRGSLGSNAVPWGDGPGRLPPMHEVDGAALVALAAVAQIHHVTGTDDLNQGPAEACWHHFADLMRDIADSAAELGEEDRGVLAKQADEAITELKQVGVKVLAGGAGRILYVAVVPRGWRRDLRLLFVGS